MVGQAFIIMIASVTGQGNAKILILGIGNTLLSDEGVGVHALHQLRCEYADQPDICFLDGGTLGFTLAAPIGETDHLIVLDAAQLNAPPGTVRVFVDAAMDEFVGYGKSNAHEIGLTDLLSIAHLSGQLPRRRALIGIQPEHIGLGEFPTATIARAMPQIHAAARQLIEDWQT